MSCMERHIFNSSDPSRKGVIAFFFFFFDDKSQKMKETFETNLFQIEDIIKENFDLSDPAVGKLLAHIKATVKIYQLAELQAKEQDT